MNERIKELVVESGNGQMRDNILYPHIGLRTSQDWEKFAELIIKECLAQCEQHYVGAVGTHAGAHNSAVKRCQASIKQHFGVK